MPTAYPLLALPDFAATTQNTAVNIAVLANDTGPGPLTVLDLTQGNNGPATVNADNTVNYVPLGPGEHTFGYTITNGSSQATGQVVVYAFASEYEVYLWKVSQADLAYTDAMQAADAERVARIEAARAAATVLGETSYAGYEANAVLEREHYDSVLAAAAAQYKNAFEEVQVVWGSLYGSAWDVYALSLVTPRQVNEAAEEATRQSYEMAVAAAVDAYDVAILPYVTALQQAQAVLLDNPDDPEAQTAYAQAEAELDANCTMAIADWQDANDEALAIYLTSLDEAESNLAVAENAARLALDAAMVPADAAWTAAEAAGWALSLSSKVAADLNYLSAESTAWVSYVADLAQSETSLAASESGYEAQFVDQTNIALSTWQGAKHATWDAYLASLANVPNPPAPEARILSAPPFTAAIVGGFSRLAIEERSAPVLATSDKTQFVGIYLPAEEQVGSTALAASSLLSYTALVAALGEVLVTPLGTYLQWRNGVRPFFNIAGEGVRAPWEWHAAVRPFMDEGALRLTNLPYMDPRAGGDPALLFPDRPPMPRYLDVGQETPFSFRALQARLELRLNLLRIKQALVNEIYSMLNTNRPTGPNTQNLTRRDFADVANELADVFIRNADRFLAEHRGATPRRGIRWAWETRETAPWCADWAEAQTVWLQTYMQNNASALLRACVNYQWGQYRGTGEYASVQHNFLVLNPMGYAWRFSTATTADSGIRIFDPWRTILPTMYHAARVGNNEMYGPTHIFPLSARTDINYR